MNMRGGHLTELDLDENIADRFRLNDGADQVADHDESWLAWFENLHLVDQMILIALPFVVLWFALEAWL